MLGFTSCRDLPEFLVYSGRREAGRRFNQTRTHEAPPAGKAAFPNAPTAAVLHAEAGGQSGSVGELVPYE